MLKLKELREYAGITQLELANKIGTSQTNIGRWERELNEPTSSAVIKLADFFDCTTDYLLGREDDFGNVVSGKAFDVNSEDEQKLLSAFRTLDAYEKESILIQVNALAREKSIIKK